MDDRVLRATSFSDESVPVMELLLQNGPDVNALSTTSSKPYPLIFGPSNTLAPKMPELLLSAGARPDTPYGNALALVLANNNCNPAQKSACLYVWLRSVSSCPTRRR